MGTIVISTNLSLDGIVEDPDGQEGSRPGGWFTRTGGRDLEPWAAHGTEEALGAEALLLGRRSDRWFAARWNDRPGVWADRLRALPKYVVSSTTEEPAWHNGSLITGDVPAGIAKLKAAVDGEILVYASYTLVRTLFEHDLVDQVRLSVFPVVVGGGQRLFGPLDAQRPLRRLGHRTLGEGITLLSYEVVR